MEGKFTPELREAYVKTLARCGKQILADEVHNVSSATVSKAKRTYPGFKEACSRAVKQFHRLIISGSR